MTLSLDHYQTHYMTEALTRVLYSRVLCSGDAALDVGANRGDHTLEMARLVGATGMVHAVEPNRSHLPGLLSLGSNVIVWPFAAGETLAVANLYIPSHNDGWASLNDRRTWMPDARFIVQSVIEVPLDSIEEIAAARVAFVKIDVEDHELSALRGMRKLIATSQPVIVFENATDEIAALLADLQYKLLDLYGRPYKKGELPFVNCIALSGVAPSRIVEMTTVPQSVIEAEFAGMMRTFNQDELRSRAEAAEADAKALRRERDAFRNSTSWRITAPLRSLGHLLGR